jgi:hypothetical protein
MPMAALDRAAVPGPPHYPGRRRHRTARAAIGSFINIEGLDPSLSQGRRTL